MTRQPRFAGYFYPKEKDTLLIKIRECYNHRLGAGVIGKPKNAPLTAVIVPHAGYDYSGPCATHAYKLIAESKTPDVYIIIGPSHSTIESEICTEDHKTPLGIIPTDKGLAKKLAKQTGIKIGEQTQEHSIEVQLPFLQHAKKDAKPKIITLMLSDDVDLEKTAKAITELTQDKEVTYIISSDFTHYGKSYGYTPFIANPEKLKQLDKNAIKYLLDLNTDGFIRYISQTGATICGYLPILLLLIIFTQQKKKPITKQLMYYTSAELTNDKNNSVSYASISFK